MVFLPSQIAQISGQNYYGMNVRFFRRRDADYAYSSVGNGKKNRQLQKIPGILPPSRGMYVGVLATTFSERNTTGRDITRISLIRFAP